MHLTLLTRGASQRAWLAGEDAAVKSMGREVLRASGFAARLWDCWLCWPVMWSNCANSVCWAQRIAYSRADFRAGLAWCRCCLPICFSAKPVPDGKPDADHSSWRAWADRMQAVRQPMAVLLVLSAVLLVVGLSQVRTDVRAVDSERQPA